VLSHVANVLGSEGGLERVERAIAEGIRVDGLESRQQFSGVGLESKRARENGQVRACSIGLADGPSIAERGVLHAFRSGTGLSADRGGAQ
jgi:hypothetical protein